MKRATVGDQVDAITRLGIVLRLEEWSSAKAKREIKAPKLHFMDTGLATALLGEDTDQFGIEAIPASMLGAFPKQGRSTVRKPTAQP